MASFTTQKGGFVYVTDLFLSITQDLVANGFALKFPSTLPPAPTAGAKVALFKATLEFTETGDMAAQPWRIQFDASRANIGSVNVATPIQLPNDGSTAVIIPTSGSNPPYPIGMLNTTGVLSSSMTASRDYSDTYFVYRDGNTSTDIGANAFPLSYRLSVTPRGVAIVVWEDASDAATVPNVSWLVVQRPVDHVTGQVFVTGHAPVFAVYGMAGMTRKFVVRENDVLKPSPSVPADSNTEDSRAILNTANQVSITEDNRYVITFPNGLNTPRYSYTQELDMMAYTSADVVADYTNVPLTVYGEAQPRMYKAMRSMAGNSTGMRLLVLVQGGGAVAAP